jgi:site-specific DNA-adenine methylase
VDAVRLFSRVGTQWRMGGFGAVGIDYNALYLVAEKTMKMDVTEELLDKVRVLERETLDLIAERQDEQDKQRDNHGRRA